MAEHPVFWTVVALGISAFYVGPQRLKFGSRLVGNRLGKAVGRYGALQEEFHKRGMASEVSKLQDEIRSEMKDLGTVKDEIMQVSRLNITQPITANAPIAQKHGGQPSQGGAASMPSAPVSQPRASTQHDSFAHPISASPVSAILASQQVQEEPDEGTMPRSLLYTVAEEKFVSDAGGKSALTMDTSEAVDAADLVSASIMQSIVLRHVESEQKKS